MEQPTTETISPDRLRELIEVYNLQCFRGDTALALEELQRLRHYVATCGGTDNDGRCPMHHLAGVSKDTSEDDAFCGDCGEKLEAVRPGKHQHIGPCPSPGASAEPDMVPRTRYDAANKDWLDEKGAREAISSKSVAWIETLLAALRSAEARLNQPVFNNTESAGNQAANILRADIKSALSVIRTALKYEPSGSAPEPSVKLPPNVTRYKVVQDKGEYCLKGCPDGDLVDFSAYAALLAKSSGEPAGGHGNPCPLCKAHNLASCECPQEDHVDSVKVQPAFYRIQHKFDKGRFNDFSTDMWDLIIPGLPLTKGEKP